MEKEKKSKPLPTGIKILIGCVGALVLLSIFFGLIGRVVFSKFGWGFLKNTFEGKTGVKLDAEGKTISVKDKKSGAEIKVGENTLPEGFPKDFPLYPEATISGNISGAENQAGKGFWVMMASGDTSTKVTSFYESELPKSGWTVDKTMGLGPSSTWQVSKGKLAGTVIIGANERDKGTSIVITVQPKENAQTPIEEE